VVDTSNHRVQTLYDNGYISWTGYFGSYRTGLGQFKSPVGVTFANNGDVYVSDTNNHRVQRFVSGGGVLAWGTYGSGDGQFKYPKGVIFSTAGYIYITDTNNRVQKFAP